jgi:hypothetical protein
MAKIGRRCADIDPVDIALFGILLGLSIVLLAFGILNWLGE